MNEARRYRRVRNSGEGLTEFLASALLIVAIVIVAIVIITMVTSAPANAFPSASRPIAPLECHVRSLLAEADGDAERAIGWAESLAALDPPSSFAYSRVAMLHEAAGEDSVALEWGVRALALDSLDSDAAMLVGRMRVLAGRPELAAQALTPPLRKAGAMPELFALRALAHEADRNYGAALEDLKRTGPLLPQFEWIATGILGMALQDGRLDEAYEAFELAIRFRPDDRQTLTLGLSLAQRTGNSELERTLERALGHREFH